MTHMEILESIRTLLLIQMATSIVSVAMLFLIAVRSYRE